MNRSERIRALINRLARLDAAQTWDGALNPAQRSALDYLGQANRFSRSPSHVAEYLGATRGTISQTLKALLRKGFVSEERSAADKRSISYQLTDAGRQLADANSLLSTALVGRAEDELARMETFLRDLLGTAIRANQSKPFGICHTCRYFKPQQSGGYCALLQVELAAAETQQICHEHEAA